MGLSQSLWTGLSGLKSFQTWTDVVGNNLANSSTEGYKTAEVNFADMLSKTINGAVSNGANSSHLNPKQVGTGTSVAAISRNFNTGGFEYTGRTFDCALEGNGFFVLNGGGGASDYYTRNGSFYLGAPESSDTSIQKLLSSEGLSVQGYNAEGGIIGTALGDITLPARGTLIDGVATTGLTLAGNIDANQDVIAGNALETINSTAGSGFLSDNASTVNLGGVQSTESLVDADNNPASADTDLTELSFERSAGYAPFFAVLPDGYTSENRQVTVEFRKGDGDYQEATFVYGEDGTTLGDFCNWMCGGLGDDGSPETQRLDGGVLGTLRTREYTKELDGFAAPAEQAGSYLERHDDGSISLSVASNLGSVNSLNSFRITTLMTAEDEEGKTHNFQQLFTDFLEEDKRFSEDVNGGTAVSNFNVFVTDPEAIGNITEETRSMRYTLVSRDSDGSTWRWYVDGYEGGEGDLNKGTGIVRFGSSQVIGQSQVSSFTVDGNTDYTFDAEQLTQVGGSSSVVAEGDGNNYGVLDDFVIDQYGVIQGTYTNGIVENLAKIGTAIFPNDQGLIAVGGTMFQQTEASGEPMYNDAIDDDAFPPVLSNWLESSNVSMSREMSNLLLSQRGYQLSSRIVTTADEMLKEASQLKR